MSGISNIGAGVSTGTSGGARPASSTGTSSFADALKGQIDEVSRLQQDATKAVEDLSTGKSDDVTGVMTAMEKSDLAFKTLLAIRSKLMDAYDEVKNIPL
jgi:flagellar hook-basal body complex protein FliE